MLMSPTKRLLFVASLLLVTLGCDQTSKLVARSCLEPTAPVQLLGGAVSLTLTSNTGAFLGLGAQLPPAARLIVLLWLVGLVMVGGLCFLLRAQGLSWPSLLAGTLMVAGGVSNLVDRILLGGCVTDFVVLRLGRLHTGVFNLADVAIMAGMGVLVVITLRKRDQSRGET